MWPDSAETRDLLDRVADDDPSAEDRLWERHREPLRRMIGLRLDRAIGRRVDASDVVQEVMLKASGRLADYLQNPSMPFHLWLRQIARDHVIDAHRKHRVAGDRSVNREAPTGTTFADQSSIELAARLRDPSPTPAARPSVESWSEGSRRPRRPRRTRSRDHPAPPLRAALQRRDRQDPRPQRARRRDAAPSSPPEAPGHPGRGPFTTGNAMNRPIPMPNSEADAAAEERDHRLAELLESLTDERLAGREPDLDAAARLHPDLAEELRELWPPRPSPTSWPGSRQPSRRDPGPRSPSSRSIRGLRTDDSASRTAGGVGARRDGRRPPRAGRSPGPDRRHQAALPRGRVVPKTSSDSAPRPSRGAASSTPTSSRSSTWASPKASRTGDALRRRDHAGQAIARRPAPADGGRHAAGPGLPGHRTGASTRRLAPRPQAVEHPDRPSRAPLVGDFGLAKRIDLGSERPDRDRGEAGDAQLHGSGAGREPAGLIGPATDVYGLGRSSTRC